MLVEMKEEHNLDPNRFCYSAVIKALAKGGQWKRALEMLNEMREYGLSADPVVYTAAIGACEKVYLVLLFLLCSLFYCFFCFTWFSLPFVPEYVLSGRVNRFVFFSLCVFSVV